MAPKIVSTAAIRTFRDGMEITEQIGLEAPSPKIESPFRLEQGMEIRHIGSLVTVQQHVSREGQERTRQFQAQQLSAASKFTADIGQIFPAGSVIFQAHTTLMLSFHPDDKPGLIQQTLVQIKGPAVIVPSTADLKVPRTVDNLFPKRSWEEMGDAKYEIADRLIAAYGTGRNLPDGARVILPGVVKILDTWVQHGALSGVDMAVASVTQVGYDKTMEKGKKLHPRPKNSPVKRAPKGGKKKGSSGPPPGTALN